MRSTGFLEDNHNEAQPCSISRKVPAMRSDIVFDALRTKNRFELCHEAFKAVRLLHKDNTRIADTTNDALVRLASLEQPEGLNSPEKAASPSLEPALTPCEED